MQNETELLKAEYERIKSEQAQRIGFRDNMLFVQMAAVGGVASWVLSNLNPASPSPSSPYAAYALLVIPWLGIVLGWTYVVNDHLISRMGKYVRTVLSPRAANIVVLKPVTFVEDNSKQVSITDVFGWEPFHRTDKRRLERKRGQCLVDIFTFVFPGFAALAGFVYLKHPISNLDVRSWLLSDWALLGAITIELGFLVILTGAIIAYADFGVGTPDTELATGAKSGAQLQIPRN